MARLRQPRARRRWRRDASSGAARLDDVVAGVGRRISFIKIDAESHELAILRGSVATLRQHHPNLLVEIEQRHSPVPVQETIDFIRSQGYDGYFLDASGSRRPLGQFDVSRDQKPGWGNMVRII